jgi:hypothetical protein
LCRFWVRTAATAPATPTSAAPEATRGIFALRASSWTPEAECPFELLPFARAFACEDPLARALDPLDFAFAPFALDFDPLAFDFAFAVDFPLDFALGLDRVLALGFVFV